MFCIVCCHPQLLSPLPASTLAWVSTLNEPACNRFLLIPSNSCPPVKLPWVTPSKKTLAQACSYWVQSFKRDSLYSVSICHSSSLRKRRSPSLIGNSWVVFCLLISSVILVSASQGLGVIIWMFEYYRNISRQWNSPYSAYSAWFTIDVVTHQGTLNLSIPIWDCSQTNSHIPRHFAVFKYEFVEYSLPCSAVLDIALLKISKYSSMLHQKRLPSSPIWTYLNTKYAPCTNCGSTKVAQYHLSLLGSHADWTLHSSRLKVAYYHQYFALH